MRNRCVRQGARDWVRAVAAGVVLMGALGALSAILVWQRGTAGAAVSALRLEQIPFDGARAYEYLKQICALGPRPSGSRGMASQQQLLAEHFGKLGGRVEWQRFRARHPRDGSDVLMANLIVQFHPERTERILLCTHYDTLPYPMLDPIDPHGLFVGANDGASGTALLMALGHDMPTFRSYYGVDFVFFDGEEFVFGPDDPYFLGSEYFATCYASEPPKHRYRWAVLLDMIGDAHLEIYQEGYSMGWADTRPLVQEIWATARRLGVREFVPRRKYDVRDDHIPLHEIGKIPACNLIDFDYPAWHTRQDTPERCSALSLAKVGWVVREWLRSTQPSRP